MKCCQVISCMINKKKTVPQTPAVSVSILMMMKMMMVVVVVTEHASKTLFFKLTLTESITHKSITVRLTFLTHSVRMRPNFQGLPWFECDGFFEDELLIRFC